MGIKINNRYYKFKAFMFVYWAMMLSIMGMYTMYIAEIGFTKRQISIAVSMLICSSFISQNIFGYLADRFRSIRRLMIISNVIGIILSIILKFSQSTTTVYMIIFAWGFFLYGTVPLSEAWYMGILRESGDDREFGIIRGIGSVGYGLSGILLGILLNQFGWEIYSYYITISTIINLIIVLMIEESNDIVDIKGESISISEALRQIIRIRPLRTMVLIIFIYNFVLRGIYSYLGILVMDFGGGPISLGFAYFFDAAPEVITFALSTRLLAKYRDRDLIFIAFIMQIIRLSLILVFNSPIAIIVLGSFSGIAFGFLATAYKTFIYDVAPDKYKVSCLSLSESIIGLSGVISAPVFGFLFVKFDGHIAIAIGLLIYVILAIVLGINLYAPKGAKDAEVEC
ncbi:MAG: MFS transporter [Clostridiales bacterium]|nr:MFS transporter [Clostridiales bacterium]